jgi:predicted flap endonuclease-1-like 5' DNA nuclease
MIYLLTLGWPWFAGALALGLVVGFFTFAREKAEEPRSGGWVAAAGLISLLAGGVVAWLEALAGREAATLDIALLAGLAYAIGLPLGGVARSWGAAPAREARRAPTPLLAPPSAPAPTETPQPIIVPESVPMEGDEGPQSPAPPPAPARKPLPGAPPAMLAEPRAGSPDDLARIKGIGPKSLEKLHALGVFHYDQIAEWTLDNAKWIGAAIGAPGRVERGKWIQQARALIGAGTED